MSIGSGSHVALGKMARAHLATSPPPRHPKIHRFALWVARWAR